MNTFTKLTAAQVHIRWMIRRDMGEVMNIENSCFPQPWTEEDWHDVLRQRNNVGMIAEVNERVVGVMVYELSRTRLHVLNIAVHPAHQFRGVGSLMIAKLVGKLRSQRRERIMLEVREGNLGAQLFFRSQGFKVVSQLRDHYEDTAEDAYVFQYRLPVEVSA